MTGLILMAPDSTEGLQQSAMSSRSGAFRRSDTGAREESPFPPAARQEQRALSRHHLVKIYR